MNYSIPLGTKQKAIYIPTKTKGLAEMPSLFICLFVPFGFVMVTIGIVSFPHKSIYNYMILKENLTLFKKVYSSTHVVH